MWLLTFYQTGPNGLFIFYQVFNLILQSAGEKILLTGDSGSGKTTLFKIILGKIKPNTGTISFRNKNGQKIDQNEAKIGYIPQDPILFPDSIKNNITMFDASLNNKVATYINKFSFADCKIKLNTL